MPIYEFDGKKPQIPTDSFVHPDAVLIGDVQLGHECLIAPGVCIRAEFGLVKIGDCSNVQDNSVIHVNPDKTVIIEENVSIAHGVILHDVHIKSRCLVGMGATVMDDVVCGEDAIVASGSLVLQGMQIPAGKIAMGNPAKIVGDVGDRHKKAAIYGITVYCGLCRKYLTTMKRVV